MFALVKELLILAVSLIIVVGAFLGSKLLPHHPPPPPPPRVSEIPEIIEKASPTIEEMPETPALEAPRTKPAPEEPREEIPSNEPREQIEDPFAGFAEALQKLAEESLVEPSDTNALVRNALVNIVCATESGGSLNSISASGVVIDPRGIILTNAHVAQYYLLQDYPAPGTLSCFVRTGSPAKIRYQSELLFLPPSWIVKNAHKIDDERPTGNGEHDYALVRISGTRTDEPVPASLPFLPLLTGAPKTSEPVLVAGYAAGFLGGITVQKELYASSATTKVGELYTFLGNTVDLFSVGGSVVAQQGSSGGAVTNQNGELLGVIVTSSEASETANRDLRAISTEYILRDFASERGMTLQDFLSLNPQEQATLFRITTLPTLAAQLILELVQ